MGQVLPSELQALSDLATILYDFLPGKPHPYADPSLSFQGAASRAAVGDYWRGGSKQPAIVQLLRDTLGSRRDRFCRLILEIVNTSITYRSKKNPVTREEIGRVNECVRRLGFKIPELWDPTFLGSLRRYGEEKLAPGSKPDLSGFSDRLITIGKLEAQERGYAFERFLTDVFSAFGLAAESGFRLAGEQIDGSFVLDGETYLVEARWRGGPASAGSLYEFSGKVERKAHWTRGFFISYAGYSTECFEAYERGAATRIICMDALDLHYVVSGKADLAELLRKKVRRAAETNSAFVSARELF